MIYPWIGTPGSRLDRDTELAELVAKSEARLWHGLGRVAMWDGSTVSNPWGDGHL